MSKFYQLILLGDTGCEACRKVRERFFELLNERGLEKSLVAVLDGTLTMTPRWNGGRVPVSRIIGVINNQ